MIYQHLFDRVKEKKVVRAALIGSGHFGTAIVTQAQSISLLEIPVIADRNIEAARRAYQRAGIINEAIVVCDNRASALRAIESGKFVIVEDSMIAMELPVDVIVESTGVPEAAACHAYHAIQNGKHVVMISKEMDVVIAPILKHLADRAGVVYTPVDGDQHGVLIGLISWARSLGLEVLCGGKARNAEFVHDEAKGIVSHGRHSVTLGEEETWALNPISGGQVDRYIKARREISAKLPQISNSDRGEMAIAMNATGLLPDTPTLHVPVVRIRELPEVLCPIEEGGILQVRGAIDAVTCLRSANDSGLGGGVFVVVSCENDYSRDILTTKGLIPNSRGSTALIYRPYHLCGVEAPISILCAGLLNVPTGSTTVQPLVDLVAKSKRAFKKGEIIDSELDALITPAKPVTDGNPVPFYMLAGNQFSQDVPAGTLITCEMISQPSDSTLWSLRAQQEAHFSVDHANS